MHKQKGSSYSGPLQNRHVGCETWLKSSIMDNEVLLLQDTLQKSY